MEKAEPKMIGRRLKWLRVKLGFVDAVSIIIVAFIVALVLYELSS